MSFSAGGTPHNYPILLPVCLTHFLSPVILSAAHFTERWDTMADGEAVLEGPSKLRWSLHLAPLSRNAPSYRVSLCTSMDPASFTSVQGKLRTIKFGLGTDALDEGGAGLLCAAALHTTSRNKVCFFF